MQASLYNANIPNEYEVLHALPYNFKVDDQDYIEDPLEWMLQDLKLIHTL